MSHDPGLAARAAASRTVRPFDGAAPREGQTFTGRSLPVRYASLVKLPHTLFALPFAGLGAVLASYRFGSRTSAAVILWIVVAFTAARFAAMAFNRLVDRKFDARNPRTRDREIPAGRLSRTQVALAVGMASAIFLFAAFRLNPLCGVLAPVALAWVFLYSYTKRFTVWAHHVLGLALGIAPVGGYLAIAGQWTDPWWALPLLAAAVTFWVAGFDMIYAVQDIDFDRAEGLHSVPARRGAIPAVALARASHAIAVGLFFLIWWLRPFPVGGFYLAGVGVMAALLMYENWTVRNVARRGLDAGLVDRAFFRTNVAVSMSLFALTLADRLVGSGAAL